MQSCSCFPFANISIATVQFGACNARIYFNARERTLLRVAYLASALSAHTAARHFPSPPRAHKYRLETRCRCSKSPYTGVRRRAHTKNGAHTE